MTAHELAAILLAGPDLPVVLWTNFPVDAALRVEVQPESQTVAVIGDIE